jgi:predicted RNase H-like HicB family nuclease
MPNPINLTIERFQENGQDYYVATSADIQGLVAEADTIDAVIDIAKDLIPILLELETKDRQSSPIILSTANQFQIPLLVS